MTLSQLLHWATKESNGDLEAARTMLRERNTVEAYKALGIIAKRAELFTRKTGVKPTLISIRRSSGYVEVAAPDLAWCSWIPAVGQVA